MLWMGGEFYKVPASRAVERVERSLAIYLIKLAVYLWIFFYWIEFTGENLLIYSVAEKISFLHDICSVQKVHLPAHHLYIQLILIPITFPHMIDWPSNYSFFALLCFLSHRWMDPNETSGGRRWCFMISIPILSFCVFIFSIAEILLPICVGYWANESPHSL